MTTNPSPSPHDQEMIQRRIAQFETMVRPEADPTNDMAWFSLGGAYAQAGRHLDAAGAYRRSVELNPSLTKSFQLGGKALIDAGKQAEAIEFLTRGYSEAASRGDRMPMQGIETLLRSLNAPVPEVKAKAVTIDLSKGDMIVDRKTGQPGRKLAKPPMRGPAGAWIQANVSAETWDAWIRQGTKVINELRLDLSREQDGETYDRHMWEFLGITEEEAVSEGAKAP